MSAMSLRLPESLHRRVRELARREGISINQLVSTAVAEKMSALMTAEYLQTRAARASRANWRAALAAVPATEALSDDEWGTEAPNPRLQLPGRKRGGRGRDKPRRDSRARRTPRS